MGKIINQVILLVMLAGFSLSSFAYGDDEKKTNSKKNSHLNPFNKKHTASSKDKEDTLVYDKALEDTLTFGDGKSSDDTLIFADDEKQMMGKPNARAMRRCNWRISGSECSMYPASGRTASCVPPVCRSMTKSAF